MVLVTALAFIAFSAPAFAQSDPSLYQSAPTEDAGTVSPSDGGRSVVLLGLAGVAALGACVLGAFALRPGRRGRPVRGESPPVAVEPVSEAPVAPEPVAPERVWRPRVVSDLPPLPAFGSERPPDAQG